MLRRLIQPFGGMAVENRPAEGHMLGRVAVAANRHVPPGHHELELLRSGITEDGDAVLLAVAAGIVFELLVDPLVPLGADDALEGAANAFG